eukprot:gnl/TRDRNA2_/TRDRNA2_186877_c0_seq1.p1 gnl/TRDRNA2_/TRDRNA2_186877_c0~~gnl/TRDRNA2_/TRDRNA2_186877_c0_seq1.p1  ORF type:complete len:447 (-),score=60.04 gnl/TRDRNA2_/TRDRNA2_186877_c0_seq1:216-1556(-)
MGAHALLLVVAVLGIAIVHAGRHIAADAPVVHKFHTHHAEIELRSEHRGLRRAGGGAVAAKTTSWMNGDPVRILHITDSHVSISNDDPPHTSRMFGAFAQTTDRETGMHTSSHEELSKLIRMAATENVDLIALGGDIVNFPSRKSVGWVLQQLDKEATGIPFIYTAGNHDWHTEGIPDSGRYDFARVPQLHSTLSPLFEQSVAKATCAGAKGALNGTAFLSGSTSNAGRLYGCATVKGIDVLFVDNSNYQVNQEQFAFVQKQLADHERQMSPALLLLHMPLQLPGVDLPTSKVCGRPDWGAATDTSWEVEGRTRWPSEGNLPSTQAFIELVQNHSAPDGRLVAMLTGHVHKDFHEPLDDKVSSLHPAANLTALACARGQAGCWLSDFSVTATGSDSDASSMSSIASLLSAVGLPGRASGAVQYTTLDAAEGGYRLVTVRRRSAETS